MPLRLKRGHHLLKLEPSAQIPWQKTMLGLVFVDAPILGLREDSYAKAMVDARLG